MSQLNANLVIAISSRALFDLVESHQVFEQDGVEAYCDYQINLEDKPLNEGAAFDLVKKLLSINNLSKDCIKVEVILLSRNSADTGLRIFNSIHHHKLDIKRAVFTNGENTFPYVPAFGAHLFLSLDPNDVTKTLEAGYAAATILKSNPNITPTNQVRIAFDGDAVLFSDESERIFQEHGLDAFQENERSSAKTPLNAGPFKDFLDKLHKVQATFPIDSSPIRTALVTARAAPAHERAIRTFRHWGIRIDEVLFLGGLDKGPFLKAFGADIFFDDQAKHCDSARQFVSTGHVPSGIKNQK
jgi:5'-nucleotidase